jgi:hypothetical protein
MELKADETRLKKKHEQDGKNLSQKYKKKVGKTTGMC